MAAGRSLADLAAAVHYSKGHLSKVETGAVQANHALAVLCDDELETGGALVRLLPRTRRGRGRPRTQPPPFDVPPPARHFVGRKAEAARVRAALLGEAATVCTVDGMAGVGKTALAIRVVHDVQAHFADGCLFVDLRAGVDDEASVAGALDRCLRVLGVPGEQVPSDLAERAALYRARLTGKQMLLVFDNARAAGQVRQLLPTESRCRVLITSRNRLTALDEAVRVSLTALTEPEARSLFDAVAGGEHEAAQVVRQCGLLPLAVRIAAARLRVNSLWTVADLGRRLADEKARLGELDDGDRSVRAAFLVSYEQLPDGQRRLFDLLALLPGADFDAPCTAALAGLDVHEARRLLDRLLDSHLLSQNAVDRYQLHDLLRVFATTVALPAVPEQQRQVAVSRLVEHYLYASEQADRLLTPLRHRRPISYLHPVTGSSFRDKAEALDWFGMEWPNLVEVCDLAAEHGLRRQCWQLAYAAREYFFHTKLCDAWVRTHLAALESARQADDQWAEAVTLANLGMARMHEGRLEDSAACYAEALPLFQALGDEHGVVNTMASQAWVSHYRGDNATAVADMRTALDFYERVGAGRNAAIALRGIALMLTELGEHDEASRCGEEALARFTGDDLDTVMTLNCLGWNYFRAGRHDLATENYRRAAELAEQCGSDYERARAETGLGNVTAAADRDDEARRHWAVAEELHPDLLAVVVGETRARLRPTAG
jgi:tetratricopeptide (TPR) repeat protein